MSSLSLGNRSCAIRKGTPGVRLLSEREAGVCQTRDSGRNHGPGCADHRWRKGQRFSRGRWPTTRTRGISSQRERGKAVNPIKGSLRYPAVTLSLTLGLLLAGTQAILHMPRMEDPNVTIRTGIVAALYPGATSDQVES